MAFTAAQPPGAGKVAEFLGIPLGLAALQLSSPISGRVTLTVTPRPDSRPGFFLVRCAVLCGACCAALMLCPGAPWWGLSVERLL